jgi:hypothetical protein
LRPCMNDAGTFFDGVNNGTAKNHLYDSHSIERIIAQALDDMNVSKLMSNEGLH